MKYLSLILVIFILQLTWWVSQQKRDLSVSQHNKITNLIREYMTQAVKSKEPNATDIEFSNVYTEVLEKGRKMKAHFKFSYMQPNKSGEPSKVYRKGSFFIASQDGDNWKAKVDQINDVQVEFLDPQTIQSNENPTKETSEPLPTEESNHH